MTFIDLILKHTLASESPRRYYYWAALAAIAGVVRNQVYIDRFQYKLFPNIYVILVGRSGLRKGPPINLATELVSAIDNTKIMKGRSSIQAILTEASQAITKSNGGPPVVDATVFLAASEFASFIIGDPQALTILTDLYDSHYHKDWINRTKVSGQERLKNPCFTLFGASNEVHIKDALPDNAMGGGFLARTFIIYANEKSTINSLTRRPEHLVPWDDLVRPLREISKCKGQFEWSDAGRDLYDDWYNEFQKQDLEEDDTGTLERVHDHILKTAMLVSLSRKTDLRLEHADIEEAIRACQDFVPGAKRVALGQVGKSISAPGTSVLLRALINHPDNRLRRSEALQKYWRHFDAPELDRISASLLAQRGITIAVERGLDGKPDEIYILNPKVLDRYNKKKEE